MEFYSNDSFFTLDPGGRLGLVALSTALAIVMLWLTMKMRQSLDRLTKSRLIALPAAFLLFCLFLWLSPQLYYTYYKLIIPGLPDQIVIGLPPNPLPLLGFQGKADLSHHARGILGWLMIAISLWPKNTRPC